MTRRLTIKDPRKKGPDIELRGKKERDKFQSIKPYFLFRSCLKACKIQIR